jgi:MtfA peptidase
MCKVMNETAVISVWPVIVMTITAALGVLGLMAKPWLVERRRARLRAAPFPAAWRRILRRRVPLVAQLPTDLQLRLKRHIQVFIAEKPFIGCQGQAVKDEVRVTIAAQACLLLLGFETPHFYPRLKEFLVYPGAFVVDRAHTNPGGVVREQRSALAGESWSEGRVVLSWADALAGAANPSDGRSVVVHEFAHQIDQDDGQANGQPWRPTASARRLWRQVMDAAFEQLRHTPSPLIDPYGATDPAEFFAVVSEVFFERPRELALEAPEAYRELAGLYGVSPAAW